MSDAALYGRAIARTFRYGGCRVKIPPSHSIRVGLSVFVYSAVELLTGLLEMWFFAASRFTDQVFPTFAGRAPRAPDLCNDILSICKCKWVGRRFFRVCWKHTVCLVWGCMGCLAGGFRMGCNFCDWLAAVLVGGVRSFGKVVYCTVRTVARPVRGKRSARAAETCKSG